jgi:hypothetical protein
MIGMKTQRIALNPVNYGSGLAAPYAQLLDQP